MANYSIERLPGEPIIVGIFYDTFSLKEDVDPYISEVQALFNELGTGFFYVNDTRDLQVRLFQDLLVAVNKATRSLGAVLRHPGLEEYILVTTDALIRLSAQGLRAEVFGGIPATVFETMEEAMAHARSRAAEGN
jgi:hypothetical protein